MVSEDFVFICGAGGWGTISGRRERSRRGIGGRKKRAKPRGCSDRTLVSTPFVSVHMTSIRSRKKCRLNTN